MTGDRNADDAVTPRRRWSLLLNLHADSLAGMAAVLENLAWEAENDELPAERVSGGSSSGYTLHLTHDPTMTPERYASENAAHVKRLHNESDAP